MHLKALAALAAGLLVAAAGPDDSAKEEMAKFQGTWTLASAEKDGQEFGADKLADFKLVVDGNKRTLKKGDQVVSQATFKLDPKKKVIYVTITEGAQGQDPACHLRIRRRYAEGLRGPERY